VEDRKVGCVQAEIRASPDLSIILSDKKRFKGFAHLESDLFDFSNRALERWLLVKFGNSRQIEHKEDAKKVEDDVTA
jgi:hypothetical protein